MQVLLREDVEHIGRMGDVVNVADGYARNYLLPKRLAVGVTKDNMAAVSRARGERERREQEELARVNRQAQLLQGFLCYVTARATEQGHLFGSVGPERIAEQLAQSGFEGIRPTSIALERHIEEIGDYQVEVMLHPEVRATILVRVAAGDEQA